MILGRLLGLVLRIGFGVMLVCAGTYSVSAQETADPAQVFGDTYAGLSPAQRRLVDDWFRRFSELVKKPVSAEDGYNALSLSEKTTFSAVTHALIRTKLTDKSGASLGESAIVLVDKVDEVAGKIKGAGGDEQFRLYVELKPDALEILQRSEEFKRAPDNTVYHHGYPICYRSTGGTPSIQVSITRDGKRADFDVDYRSSKFPQMLVNGHLTESNSDVRSGDNERRHNQEWTGLQNWWQTLLGLPLIEAPTALPDTQEVIPPQPKIKAKEKPQIAVHDFLDTWLIQQKPNEAVSYFSEDALSCMEIEDGRSVDRGLARIAMLLGLKEVNQQTGKVSNLSEVTAGVHLRGRGSSSLNSPTTRNSLYMMCVRTWPSNSSAPAKLTRQVFRKRRFILRTSANTSGLSFDLR